jgi:hypothetical protein
MVNAFRGHFQHSFGTRTAHSRRNALMRNERLRISDQARRSAGSFLKSVNSPVRSAQARPAVLVIPKIRE